MKSSVVVTISAVACLGILLPAANGRVYADEIPAEWRAAIVRGLEYLTRQQSTDGHWAANGQEYPAAITALCGMSMLMEGSTLRQGKYAGQLRKAVDWLLSRSQPSGLLANPQEEDHHMFGHGFAVLFLSCVYGEEGDTDLRWKLQDVLTRAVLFTGRAQSVHGAWHYVSSGGEGGDSSSTAAQMQGLRAARNAGIAVPKEIIDKGVSYLRQTTNREGGVVYGWDSRGGPGSSALTAAALASSFSAGEYDSDVVKRWLQFCQRRVPLSKVGRLGHDEYLHCYLAQTMYNLGEDRYAKLFPDSRPGDRPSWSGYRRIMFDQFVRSQGADGSWGGGGIGEVYGTATRLIILQLDNGALPIYQR